MKPKILNDMINISELLKNAPEGMKLYSPLFGDVKLKYANLNIAEFPIAIEAKNGDSLLFDKYGRYFNSDRFPDGECLLFPSKDCRTWEGWNVPKPHYDINNFKPFDKVLIRVGNKSKWTCDFFSHYHKGFHCVGCDDWGQCIPYNDDTKHLLGTTDMPSEEYINW